MQNKLLKNSCYLLFGSLLTFVPTYAKTVQTLGEVAESLKSSDGQALFAREMHGVLLPDGFGTLGMQDKALIKKLLTPLIQPQEFNSDNWGLIGIKK